ncbi:MAPK regulated corepressor interacting protein 2 [Bradysia coprophila]|uniref:MAPK regulated corepressor interacting protein 2 n=1 Tax=Bradysia coprophila TaxID=38358 RepID=UPI00187D85A3|nr:MAPK regulated corepressor interacting protein 2 [Bradysia coprophila]
MYTINKCPSKLVAKSRGGISQNFEKIETIREISRKCSENCDNEINVPRPVFQQPRKAYHHHTKEQKLDSETSSPQHQELVEYIRDSWNIISASNQPTNTYEQSDDAIQSVPAKRIVYHDAPPSPVLKDFGAFDLESWWGRRLFNNITKSL